MSSFYNLLSQYHPQSPREVLYKEQMLAFFEACPDCFLRSCPLGHFTASAFLLNREKTHVCLMYHKKLQQWMQLGGHTDGESDVLAAAIREAQEESGIHHIEPLQEGIFDLDIHLIPEKNKERPHYHYDCRFLLYAPGDNELKKNHESEELLWVPKDESNGLLLKNCQVLFDKWRQLHP